MTQSIHKKHRNKTNKTAAGDETFQSNLVSKNEVYSLQRVLKYKYNIVESLTKKTHKIYQINFKYRRSCRYKFKVFYLRSKFVL